MLYKDSRLWGKASKWLFISLGEYFPRVLVTRQPDLCNKLVPPNPDSIMYFQLNNGCIVHKGNHTSVPSLSKVNINNCDC